MHFAGLRGPPEALTTTRGKVSADQLGITKYTVDYFISQANLYDDAFSTVNSLFSSIAGNGGYTGTACPTNPGTILKLAPSAQVANPGA